MDTFLNNTTPPIVVGKTSEPTENEIKIIQDKFKEWKLFYIDQENGFFYFIKNPSDEGKVCILLLMVVFVKLSILLHQITQV